MVRKSLLIVALVLITTPLMHGMKGGFRVSSNPGQQLEKRESPRGATTPQKQSRQQAAGSKTAPKAVAKTPAPFNPALLLAKLKTAYADEVVKSMGKIPLNGKWVAAVQSVLDSLKKSSLYQSSQTVSAAQAASIIDIANYTATVNAIETIFNGLKEKLSAVGKGKIADPDLQKKLATVYKIQIKQELPKSSPAHKGYWGLLDVVGSQLTAIISGTF